jgi:predicted nucleic acid-binding protein
VIHLDTSALIGALSGRREAAGRLRGFISDGERLGVCTLVLYEWRRGPRTDQELRDQEVLLPGDSVVAFGTAEALLAADLYRRVKRPRKRAIDLAIAACAIIQRAPLWTLNPEDFGDIPGLDVLAP